MPFFVFFYFFVVFFRFYSDGILPDTNKYFKLMVLTMIKSKNVVWTISNVSWKPDVKSTSFICSLMTTSIVKRINVTMLVWELVGCFTFLIYFYVSLSKPRLLQCFFVFFRQRAEQKKKSPDESLVRTIVRKNSYGNFCALLKWFTEIF